MSASLRKTLWLLLFIKKIEGMDGIGTWVGVLLQEQLEPQFSGASLNLGGCNSFLEFWRYLPWVMSQDGLPRVHAWLFVCNGQKAS